MSEPCLPEHQVYGIRRDRIRGILVPGVLSCRVSTTAKHELFGRGFIILQIGHDFPVLRRPDALPFDGEELWRRIPQFT